MTSRFTQTRQVGKLTVKAPKDSDVEVFFVYSKMVLDEAKKHLETCQSHLDHPPPAVVKAAHRCFLTGLDEIPSLELLNIKTIITKTWNGLTGDVTLKIADNLKTSGKYGEPVQEVGGFVQKKSVYRLKSPQNIIIEELDTGRFLESGMIHLDAAAIRAFSVASPTKLNKAVLHMIHEATHKYAGTKDYCYFDYDTLRPVPLPPNTEFDDMPSAIINADSYALFVGLTGGTFNSKMLPQF